MKKYFLLAIMSVFFLFATLVGVKKREKREQQAVQTCRPTFRGGRELYTKKCWDKIQIKKDNATAVVRARKLYNRTRQKILNGEL